MMRYRKGGRRKSLSGRTPVKWADGESIVFSVPGSELVPEVGEGKELMGGVEVFVVFAVAALDFSVMPGRVGLDKMVANMECI